MEIIFREHQEGFGGLYQYHIGAYFLSLYYDIDYTHKRPDYIHHYKSNGVELSTYIDDCEAVMAFLRYHRELKLVVTQHMKEQIIKDINSGEMLFKLGYTLEGVHRHNIFKNFQHLYATEHVSPSDIFQKVQEYMRDMFHTKMEYVPKHRYFDDNKVTVAIHIRNRNEEDTMPMEISQPYECFSTNYNIQRRTKKYIQYYQKLMSTMMSYNDRCHFYIFSQGNESEFDGLRNENSTILLNIYVPDTFYHLVTANVIIMSRSSFSYLASLLSKGVKISKDGFRHPLPTETIIINYDVRSVSINTFDILREL